MTENKKYNKIKAHLAFQGVRSKELAGKLDVTPQTVSKWCTNRGHPSIPQLYSIAAILKINAFDLLIPNTNDSFTPKVFSGTNSSNKTYYNRVKYQLAMKGVRSKELAEKLDITPQTVSKWCTNYSNPSIPELYAMADALKINAFDLLEPEPVYPGFNKTSAPDASLTT